MVRQLIARSLALATLMLIPAARAESQSPMIERSRLSPAVRNAMDAGRLHVADSSASRRVPPQAGRVRLAAGEFLVARTSEPLRLDVRTRSLGAVEPVGGARPDSVLLLPLRVVGWSDDRELVELRAVLNRETAVLDRERGVFRGTLSVGLEDTRAPGRVRKLAGGVRMRAMADADSVLPREYLFEETNRRAWDVSVISAEPFDSIRVRIIPEFLPDGIDVWVPVQPAIVVPALPARVTGYGFEAVRVPVAIRGARPRDSVIVSLFTDLGNFAAQHVAIDAAGSGTAVLRTRGRGPASISASSPGFHTATATIDFGWPLLFLLAALAGGTLGGVYRDMQRSRRRIGTRVRGILAGTLTGLVVAIAYFALGISLLPIDLTPPFFNEAAIFALAMLGGAFGASRLTEPRSNRAPVAAAAGGVP